MSLYTLELLSKKRRELISSLFEEDYLWIDKTFESCNNSAAFGIVLEMYRTLWIDNHFKQVMEDDVPEDVKCEAYRILYELISTTISSYDNVSFAHSMLEKKMKALENLYRIDCASTQQIKIIEFSYNKDKYLFEKEFNRRLEELDL